MSVSVTVGTGTVAEAVGGFGVLDGGTDVDVAGRGVNDGVTVKVNVGVIGVSVGVVVRVDGWKGVSDGNNVSVADGVRLGPAVAVSRLGVGDGPAVVVGVAVRAPGGV